MKTKMLSSLGTRQGNAVGKIALALVLAVVLTGCGDGVTGNTDAPDEGTTEGEAPADNGADGGASESQETEVTIDFASFHGPDTPQSLTMSWWADEVEQRSNGRIAVELHFSESLVAGTEMLQGVGSNRAQAGWIGNFYHPSELPLSSVAELPFIVQDGVVLAKVFDDMYENYEPLREEYRGNNVHLLFVHPQGVNVMGTENEITELSDFEGLDIRAAGRFATALEIAGANPVALGAPEIFESMERGVIDAYSTITLEVIETFGLTEVTGHLAEVGNGAYVLGLFVMNLDVYESLDDDLRDVVDEVTEEAKSVAIENLAQVEETNCDALLDAGVEVHGLNQDVLDEWLPMLPDFEGEWIAEREDIGAEEFFDEYTDLVDSYAAESDTPSGIQQCAERS